jgi:Fe-S-cluster containining protein
MTFLDLPKPDRRICRVANVVKLTCRTYIFMVAQMTNKKYCPGTFYSLLFFHSIYRRVQIQNVAKILVNDMLIIC